MRTRRVSLSGSAVWLFATAGPALAAGKNDPKGAAAAVVIALIVAALLQFLLAILLPRFTMRLQRAIATGFWPAAGWGALVVVLTVIVGVILGQAGAAGKALVGALIAVVSVLTLAGGIGISKIIGDWALRRWDVEPIGPLSVLCGATVWAWGAAVPVIGWVPGLLGLFASLGATVQVLLHPQTFDPRRAPAPPVPAGDPPPPT